LLVECLQRIETPAERLEVVKQSIAEAGSLFTATELVELLEHRVDLFAAQGELLAAKNRNSKLMELVKVLDQRIQLASEDGTLAEHPRKIRILKKWHRYGRKVKVQQWLERDCQDDQKLVATLLAMASDPSLWTESDRRSQAVFPLELVQVLFNADDLLRRAKSINEAEPDWVTLEGELLLSSLVGWLERKPDKPD
jgi:hypothetical protein